MQIKRVVQHHALSNAQKRMYFLDQFDPAGNAYNVYRSMAIEGALDVPLFQQALQSLVMRHASLRTLFIEVDEQPRQAVQTSGRADLQYADVSAMSREEQEAQIRAHVAAQNQTPFDLAQGPLWRALLFTRRQDEHFFYVNMHHIITDGWSNDLFIRELTETYCALAQGEFPQLQPLDLQYVDYAVWQEQEIANGAYEQELTYWLDTLAGPLPVLHLPTDAARPAVQTFNGDTYKAMIPQELVASLRTVATGQQASLYMTLLAAYFLLLHHLTGDEDIIIGTPISGRTDEALEGVIGFFVNTLAIRTDFARVDTLADLLQTVKKQTLDAEQYQAVPFDLLLEQLNPERDPSRSPIFSTMFSLASPPADAVEANGTVFREAADPMGQTFSKFDLSLILMDGADGMHMVFEYNTDLFKQESIKRFAHSFENVLAAFAGPLSAPLAALDLLTEADRSLYQQLNATEAFYPQDQSIHAMFAEAAQQFPQAVALSSEAGQLTYAELDARTNQVAHMLLQQGIGTGDLVGLLMERSMETVISVLGILKAGGVYVPIDPDYPADRIRHMITDSGAPFLLTNPQHLAAAQAIVAEADSVRALLVLDEQLDQYPAHAADVAVTADDLAYIIYTSGSTGRPKGTALYHRGVLNLARWKRDLFGYSQHDTILQYASFSFDASVWESFPALINGARLHLLNQEERQSAEAFAAAVARTGATVVTLPTVFFNQLGAELAVEHEPQLSTLKRIFVAGEALQPQVVRAWQQRFGTRIEIINAYGPTEATVCATICRIDALIPDQQVTLPIGTPIANTEVYVLNRHSQLCPVGVVGELCIGSAGLAKGYLHQPDRTADVFIPHPFATSAGARLYRSGDMARLLPNGQIEWVGRRDDQVKVRGHRVELGEIEEVLLQHPQVRHAAVIAQQGADGNNALVGFYTTDGTEVDTNEVRSYLTDRLPGYMVPSHLMELDEMPLSPTGKVDRKALVQLHPSDGAQHAFVAPSTETECALAQTWSDLLQVEQISIHDDFFHLGGHSLLAMQAVNRIRKQYGLQLELKDLFAQPTLRQFAAHLDRLLGIGQIQPEAAIPPVPEQEHYALSHAQKRLWFFYQFDPASTVYHVQVKARLQGTLQLNAFDEALQALVARHATLRTVFLEVDGVPRQQVLAESNVTLMFEDVRAMGTAEQKEHVREQVRACNAVPFDLTAGPLMRVMLFQLSDQESYLYLNMHHIVTDGWSNDVLLRELSALYLGTHALEPLAIQYADYAEWQVSELEGGALAQEEAYWLQTLAKPLPVLELPTDHVRPEVQTYNGDLVTAEITPEIARRLRALSKQEDVSMFMLLLAAYNQFLHQMTRSDDIIVGTPIAGRSQQSVEPLIGFFVNTLAIRTRFNEVESLRDLVREVKRQCLDAYAHASYPFDLILEKINPERDLSRSPIFSTMFQYLQGGATTNPADGIVFAPVTDEIERTIANFDLTLYMNESQDGTLWFGFDYNTDLFKRETAERFLATMQQVLYNFAHHLNAPIGTLDLLSAADRDVYARLNDTHTVYDHTQLLHEAFVAQAEAHPERIALSYEGKTMTYGELHQRSNRLAHFLRARGVTRNTLVGLMMERGIELMVGLYAILKAGGAYVPIDPDYPVSRVQYMITDSGAPVLLTKARYAAEVRALAGQVEPLQTVLYLEETEHSPALEVAGVQTFTWRDLGAMPDSTPARINDPQDYAYIIYTSGSTGQPKGVLIRHISIVNRMFWQQDIYRATPDMVVAQRTTQCFDDSVTELFWALRHGAKLSIIPQEVVVDPERLIEHLIREEVHYFQSVPSLFRIVVSYLQDLPPQKRPHLPLRFINVGGEPTTAALCNAWTELYPNGAMITNLYGPTEAAIDVTLYHVRGPVDVVPIGKPPANMQLYVVNQYGQLCPPGVTGELLVGGIQLAAGYHNKPGKTAEAFVPNHIPGTPGDRLYRTGDLVRLMPDLNIEFVGRIDNQVKVRGYRIELGEVEENLVQHPDVELAAVIIRKGPDDNNSLYGYYTSRREDLSADELKRFLEQRLPQYMVPSVLGRLDEMPFTPNGKVDRQALTQLAESDAFTTARRYVAPSTPTEQRLAQVWRDVLRRETISVHDTFFELGGHSLLAVLIVNRVRQAFGVTVELKDLFRHESLQELAVVIDRLLEQGQVSVAMQIPSQPEQAHYSLSHAQKRMWFMHKIDGASVVYNLPTKVVYEGALDTDAFEQALHDLVLRHQSLRTVFRELNGKPRAVVHPHSDVTLRVQDLSALDHTAQQAELTAQTAADYGKPFDLAQGPMLRAILFRLSGSQYLFYFNMHHIISDGWSTDVFLRELTALYEARLQGVPANLPELTVQYTDYAHWQEKELVNGRWAQEEAYWLNQLSKPLPVLELRTDYPRPELQTFNGASLRARVPAELTAELRRLSKREGVSMHMLFLAAYIMLLHHHTQADDIIVGTPIAGRTTEQLEPLIGFFVNTLPIRTRMDGIETLRDLLHTIKRQSLDALEHQTYPFDLLVEKVNPERDPSRSPIFSTMFSFQNALVDNDQWGGWTFQTEAIDHSIAKVDLTLFVNEQAADVLIGFEYNTDLFAAASVAQFEAQLHLVLAAMAAEIDTPLNGLDLLTAEDHRVYHLLNDTARPYPTNKTITDMVATAAAKFPHRIALSSDAGELTYAELHARSNQVAHLLRSNGMNQGDFVGIFMERSIETVISLLGVMRAGGVYVPLDPDYPEERIRYMLADSGAPFLLTKQALREQAHVCKHTTEHVREVLVVDHDLESYSAVDLHVPVKPTDLAYVIYTSGSTGRPKGTLIQHQGVVNLGVWARDRYGVNETDVIVQFSSFSFDASVLEMFAALFWGGRLHLLSAEQRLSVPEFAAGIERSQATQILILPTAFFRQIVTHLHEDDYAKLSSLKRIIFGGEGATAEFVRSWRRKLGQRIQLVNAYGPTECTVFTSVYDIPEQLPETMVNIPIGRPLANYEMLILNEEQQMCGINEPGEIYVRSVGLSRGYLNQPERTGDSFIADPFRPGARLYKTGDLGKLLPSGEIECLGRKDGQVKVRGFRIELGEIEELLLQHPQIDNAAVITIEGPDGNKMLVAVYTEADTVTN